MATKIRNIKKVVKISKPAVVEPVMSPALKQLSTASPLADRCLARALAAKQALEDVIIKLKSYQDPRAARDLNDFVEVTIRSSLESIGAIIIGLNVPAAHYPAEFQATMTAKIEKQYADALKLLEKQAAFQKSVKK